MGLLNFFKGKLNEYNLFIKGDREQDKHKYNLEIENHFEELKVTSISEDMNIKYQKWEYVGFHRQLGGWMYGFGISIIGLIIGITILPWIMQNLYPFPEERGYQGVSAILFAVLYKIFDFATAFGIKRFIAEYRVKDINKMLEYIRFFIWYQMMTGLIQVTIVSYIIFKFVPNGEFGYATWLMLITLQQQYPGMLGTWKKCIEGLQHHRITHILNFITGEIFQNLTNVIFILIGRAYGEAHPEFGILMGMTLGVAIGGYIDDFFAMALSGMYLNRILKPYGFTFVDTLIPRISKDVMKDCFFYGAQTSVVPIIDTISGTWVGLMYLTFIPQWLTITAIAATAGSIAGVVSVWDFGLTQNIAESYSNGKKKLAEFYVSYSFKWQWFIGCLMFVILISYLPTLTYFFNYMPGFENYALATIFILPMMFNRFIGPLFNITGGVLQGAKHITFHTITRVLEEIFEIFFTWIFIVYLDFGSLGLGYLVFLIAFEHIFAKIVRFIIEYIYIQKKILTIKLYWMTTLIIPLLCGIPVILFSQILSYGVFYPLVDSLGILLAGIVVIIIGIFAIPFFIYLPLTGAFGAWDDFLLWTWSEASKLSGGSRIFFMPFQKSIEWGVKLGKKIKLHNRFKIPWNEAQQEMIELNKIKIESFNKEK